MRGYNILEVGAGSQGIGPYLKGKPFTEVDQNYEDCSDSANDLHPAIKAPIADASTLPFQDTDFAFVFSLDMMEHLPADMRDSALIELLRVARETVLIGFPTGEAAKKAAFKKRHRVRLLNHLASLHNAFKELQTRLENDKSKKVIIERRLPRYGAFMDILAADTLKRYFCAVSKSVRAVISAREKNMVGYCGYVVLSTLIP